MVIHFGEVDHLRQSTSELGAMLSFLEGVEVTAIMEAVVEERGTQMPAVGGEAQDFWGAAFPGLSLRLWVAKESPASHILATMTLPRPLGLVEEVHRKGMAPVWQGMALCTLFQKPVMG